MNEQEFRQILAEAIFESVDFAQLNPRVDSFDEAGMLTMNEGLVVRLAGGAEFQVTIVQSQRERDQ